MKWTADEITLLRINYSTISKDKIEKLLPNRNWRSIVVEANRLGVRRRTPTPHLTMDEIEYVKNSYPFGIRVDDIAKTLKRPPRAVRTLALRLKLKRVFQQAPMTPIKKLLENGCSILGELNEAEKGYIAGIFDGEGSVGIHVSGRNDRRNRRLTWAVTFRVTTTDSSLVEWFRTRIAFIRTRSHAGYGQNRKRIYSLSLGTYATVKFCQEIAPYLIIKRPEAELVAEKLKDGFSHLTEEQRFKLRAALSSYKTKGPELQDPVEF